MSRRISDSGLLAVELCRILNLELGVSLARAAEIATHCLHSSSDLELRYRTPSGLVLSVSGAALRERLRARATEAIEMVPDAPRGRPRASR